MVAKLRVNLFLFLILLFFANNSFAQEIKEFNKIDKGSKISEFEELKT